jgi:hypothetical protein
VNRRFGKSSSTDDRAGICRRGAMEKTSDLGRGVSRRFSLGRDGGDVGDGLADTVEVR